MLKQYIGSRQTPKKRCACKGRTAVKRSFCRGWRVWQKADRLSRMSVTLSVSQHWHFTQFIECVEYLLSCQSFAPDILLLSPEEITARTALRGRRSQQRPRKLMEMAASHTLCRNDNSNWRPFLLGLPYPDSPSWIDILESDAGIHDVMTRVESSSLQIILIIWIWRNEFLSCFLSFFRPSYKTTQ